MSVSKVMLLVLILIIAAVGGYQLLAYEKTAYDIRREEANLRENAIHTQEERMKKEGADRAATGRER